MQQQSERSERATIAAMLVLRDNFAFHKSNPNVKDVLLHVHFRNHTVQGIAQFPVLPTLQYDSKWLEDPSTHLTELWCSFHQSLITASSDVHIFDIMMWLSTMAYAKLADMDIIQALAALYKDPKFATIHVPLASTFELAAGDTWRLDEVQSIAQRNLRSYQYSAESRLPRENFETEQGHTRRMKHLFHHRQNTAIQSFVAALRRQWPVSSPSTPTAANASEYINITSAMKAVTTKCKDWYDNREFSGYLDRVSRLCAQQEVSPVSQPRYILPMPNERKALSHLLRKYSSEEVFAAAPPYFLSQCE